MKWRAGPAAAIQMKEIIGNEKSLRRIMLSAGSLFIFPLLLKTILKTRVFLFSFQYSPCVAWLLGMGGITHCISRDGPQAGPLRHNATFVRRRWHKLMTLMQYGSYGPLIVQYCTGLKVRAFATVYADNCVHFNTSHYRDTHIFDVNIIN